MESLLGVAAPGYDQPLALLAACHERIRGQLRTLQRLLDHLAAGGDLRQARQAATTVMRYFDLAGRHHHDDEEMDLFPLLEQTGEADIRALVARLRTEHVTLDATWQALRLQLAELAAGSATTLHGDAVAAMASGYEAHIRLENGHLLPAAARLLDAGQLAVLGRAMAARRGLESGDAVA